MRTSICEASNPRTPFVTRKRLLIISPHFPPVNAPDHQRARMMLPHLGEFGWDAHVLAFHPDSVEAARDPDLLATVPKETSVTLVNALPFRYTRPFGVGNLVWRGYRSFRREAESLCRRQPFDLVFFTTTIFGILPLGPLLLKRFGTPYVVDFQDPWVSDYYRRTGVRPPGGRFRYALASRGARRSEPEVVRQAAHVISVSPAYPEDIRGRYPDVSPERFSMMPFAAARRDFEIVRERNIHQPVFNPDDGLRHWVYLGRGGADMARALRILFGAIRDLRPSNPEIEKLRLHFVGTSYAPPALAKETITPVAREFGIADLVEERTSRLPYMQGLDLLQSADTVLVVGSDDEGYSASKVYPCVASGRPVLAVMHGASGAARVVNECHAGLVAGFGVAESDDDLKLRLSLHISLALSSPPQVPFQTDWKAFEPFTAREMTRRLCRVFDTVTGGGR